ncbi:XRE family transcriptional regulator [Lactobacillus sp. ESL0679]|uniref:XRE family transcriptional regulator n=1 Tax=Lactobacillus sp. ESL0679 TaxID=2983209 RepID=UPI0023F867BF|nr:XRE family transcriptional regulator [Lactobacillus sp. ESL0679]MDF7683793.1 XRE family transcriptional regulator [Lactobacillus sp. ESL0679]
MTTVIYKLLENKNISLNEVARKSSVPVTTLANAAKKPIEAWTIRILNAFALGLDELPSHLLVKLQPKTYQLKINDDEQKIQGVYIPDKATYYQIRSVVEASHLEGWNPQPEDIQYLVNKAYNPDPELEKEYEKIFGDSNE